MYDWMHEIDDPRDDDRPCATEAEAHVEWHLNAGVPMGQPCPWDACDPAYEPDFPPELAHPEPGPPEETYWEHETVEPEAEPDYSTHPDVQEASSRLDALDKQRERNAAEYEQVKAIRREE